MGKFSRILVDDTEMDLFNEYLNKWTFLAKKPAIISMKGMSYLFKAASNFRHNNKPLGNKSLDDFENYLTTIDIKIDAGMIGQAYGEGASYYFRNKDIKNCKAILERGLKICPDNKELMRKFDLYINGGKNSN